MSLPPHIDQLGDPLPAAGEVGRVLSEVFARPEFAPASPSLIELALRAIWSSLKGVWEWLIGPLNLGPGAGDVIGTLIMVVIAAIGFYALLRLVRAVIRRFHARSRAESASAPAAASESVARPASAAEWEARAREAAADGRWRDAAVALYHVLVLRLDERGVVRYDRAKTPGDYRREARRRPAATRSLNAFLGVFEPVAYGRVPGGRVEYERLSAAAADAGTRAE